MKLDFGIIWHNLPILFDGMQLSLVLTALALSGGVLLGAVFEYLEIIQLETVHVFPGFIEYGRGQVYQLDFNGEPISRILIRWHCLLRRRLGRWRLGRRSIYRSQSRAKHAR